MQQVKVFLKGNQPVHLAFCGEHFLEKQSDYHAHCGAGTADCTLGEALLQDMSLTCEACDYQVKMLKTVKG